MTRLAMCLLVLAAACAPVPPSPQDFVEVSQGGGFSGSSSTRVSGNDRVVTTVYAPGATSPAVTNRAGLPGGYARARRVVENRLSGVARAVTTEVCMDYGADSIRVSLPVSGITQVSVACPDAGVTDLIDAILAASQPGG